jgi:hypothetical protein
MHTCGAFDNVLRFMAPLTIEEGLLQRGLAALGDALLAGSNFPTISGRRSAQAPPTPPPSRLLPGPGSFPLPEPIRPGLPL